jgi:hypothetical protein
MWELIDFWSEPRTKFGSISTFMFNEEPRLTLLAYVLTQNCNCFQECQTLEYKTRPSLFAQSLVKNGNISHWKHTGSLPFYRYLKQATLGNRSPRHIRSPNPFRPSHLLSSTEQTSTRSTSATKLIVYRSLNLSVQAVQHCSSALLKVQPGFGNSPITISSFWIIGFLADLRLVRLTNFRVW